MGYHRAGFEVTGVDHVYQKRYPFTFIQADALEYVAAHGSNYDVIHASPPCQMYSPLNARWGYRHDVDLVGPTRGALIATGRPYVIENVPGAPLGYYVTLCGAMFGLRTYRHRRFETSMLVFQPEHPPHMVRTGPKHRRADWDAGLFISVTGHMSRYCGSLAMGIDWMTSAELSQAVPPAYAAYVGAQIMRAIDNEREENGR